MDEHSIVPDLWRYLFERYHPRTMLDIGCGEAWPVLWFLARGVSAVGIDGSAAAREVAVIPRDHYHLHDFTRGPLYWSDDPIHTDLAYSVEFLEHVEERFLLNVLDVFAGARVAAVTYAWPGQPGHHHVNLQDESYWIEKFESIGFTVDAEATRETRALPQVQQRQAYWGRTGLVLVRK